MWIVHSRPVQPWEVEDTCKTIPLGGLREAKGVFMHRRPLQYIRPQTYPFANPGRPIAQSRAPPSVSLCRSFSASLSLRDHVYSTLQTPSRAPSGQRPPLLIPSLTRPQAPTLSRRSQSLKLTAHSPLCPSANLNPLRFFSSSSTAWRCSRSTHREGSPIPYCPGEGMLL